MHPRPGGAFSSALTRITDRISVEECAALVKRSTSLVRKWANPKHPSLPNLEQALLLDRSYAAHGYGGPPIYALYGERISGIPPSMRPVEVNIVRSTLSLTSLSGELSAIVSKSIGEEHDVGGGLSSAQRLKIAKLTAKLRGYLDEIEDGAKNQ